MPGQPWLRNGLGWALPPLEAAGRWDPLTTLNGLNRLFAEDLPIRSFPNFDKRVDQSLQVADFWEKSRKIVQL